MRKSLFAAAAAAPFALLAAAPALAETTISDARTTGVSTATANNGNPDDLTLAAGSSITVTTGAAVTLNSNNILKAGGSIKTNGASDTVGVLMQGGRTGSFIQTGTITLLEDYTPEDTNKNGVVDGPFAQGSNRYGLRLTGPGNFIGPITIGSSGQIQVEGNASYGVSLESALQGDLISEGSIALTGDNTYGLRETGGVLGKIKLQGSITALGGGAQAVSIEGDVTGSVAFYGAVQASGYRVVQRSNDPAVNALLLPENLLQSGSAVSIRANVDHGVFVGAPPVGTSTTDTTTDGDGDGIIDSGEGAAAFTVFGSAPALSVGATGKDVHLGAFGTGNNAYGLIVRGSVTGDGVFDGRSGTGIRIGTGDGTVHVDGGLRLVGTVSARAFEESATGIHVRTGAIVPQLRVEGGINTQVVSALATSNARAILIEAGTGTTQVINAGTISASFTGNLGNAYAVVDQSGLVTRVVNTNVIQALVAPNSIADTAQGKNVALDLHLNTSGISLEQANNTSAGIDELIVGDILLGSGNDDVQFKAGRVIGALDFGAGQGNLLIDGGASYAGKLTSTGVMTVNVANGKLQDSSPTTINATSLNVGAQGTLIVTADPANNRATKFEVTGPATIAAGGKLGLAIASLPQGPQSYTVISSPNLSVLASTADLTATAPYLFVAGFEVNQPAGQVNLNLRRRTAAEAGLNTVQTAAFDSVYAALPKDLGIQSAFLAQNDQPGLTSMLDQMLPDHAGGVFRTLSWAAEAHGVATGDAPRGQDQAGPTRAWTNEIVLHEEKDPNAAAGYRVLAFSAAGGLESVSAKGDALGVRVGFTAGNVRNPDLVSDNLLGVSQFSAGVYWRGSLLSGLTADAQLGAGYAWGDGRREFLYGTAATGVVHRTAESQWSGYSLSGRLGLAYRADLGRAFIEPKVHADYFRLHESGYTEEGGGDGFDLTVDSRTSDILTVTGGVTAGVEWGTGFRWRPQVEVGYRSVLAGDAGDTVATIAGGTPFTLGAESIRSGAFIGRVGLRIYSDYLDLLLDAGTQVSDDYTDIDVHLTARTVF